MKFSTLILLGLVLVVAYASADETTAATTTSTSPEPNTCYSTANEAKKLICQGFDNLPILPTLCNLVIGSITSNLKCLCGLAA